MTPAVFDQIVRKFLAVNLVVSDFSVTYRGFCQCSIEYLIL